jgi:hypothetical protein
LRHGEGVGFRTGQLRQTEVENLGLAAIRHEDVGGLDVAVQDAPAVRYVEPVRNLHRQLQQQPHLERPSVDAMVEGAALEQFHRQEGTALVFVDLVDGADVRMVQRRGHPGFTQEALGAGAVGTVLGAQELERDRAMQLDVLGLEDDAHAAGAEWFENAVVRDDLANHGENRSLEPARGNVNRARDIGVASAAENYRFEATRRQLTFVLRASARHTGERTVRGTGPAGCQWTSRGRLSSVVI